MYLRGLRYNAIVIDYDNHVSNTYYTARPYTANTLLYLLFNIPQCWYSYSVTNIITANVCQCVWMYESM